MYASERRYSESVPGSGNVTKQVGPQHKYGVAVVPDGGRGPQPR